MIEKQTARFLEAESSRTKAIYPSRLFEGPISDLKSTPLQRILATRVQTDMESHTFWLIDIESGWPGSDL
jgi:hypothetical protein